MDLDELYRVLRTVHVQARAVVDTIRDPLLVLTPDMTIVNANPAFYVTFCTNRDETVGVPITQIGNGQWNIDELRFLLEKVIPNSAAVSDYSVTARFPQIGYRTMLVSAQRIESSAPGQQLLLLTIVDATNRLKREADKDILIQELHHRMKNLLSVTCSLARQTSVTGRTAEEYRDAFLGRFVALTKALEVSVSKEPAVLTDLARLVLKPYSQTGNAIEVADCPKVALSPGQAIAIGMILHELATNAIKYGALSVKEGRINLDWKIKPKEEGIGEVRLRWKESNGPVVTSLGEDGFGMRLVRFAAERDLGGRAELLCEPGGLVATVWFPTADWPSGEDDDQ